MFFTFIKGINSALLLDSPSLCFVSSFLIIAAVSSCALVVFCISFPFLDSRPSVGFSDTLAQFALTQNPSLQKLAQLCFTFVDPSTVVSFRALS